MCEIGWNSSVLFTFYRQENASFSPNIHTTWEEPFRDSLYYVLPGGIPGYGNKRDPERENLAVLTIAAQTANLIHIRVTFIVATRYSKIQGGLFELYSGISHLGSHVNCIIK